MRLAKTPFYLCLCNYALVFPTKTQSQFLFDVRINLVAKTRFVLQLLSKQLERNSFVTRFKPTVWIYCRLRNNYQFFVAATAPTSTNNAGSSNSSSILTNAVNGQTNNNPLPSLLGAQQPIGMPQFILASGQLVHGIQGAQLLIPTSQGKNHLRLVLFDRKYITSGVSWWAILKEHPEINVLVLHLLYSPLVFNLLRSSPLVFVIRWLTSGLVAW